MQLKEGVRILALNGAPIDRKSGSELVVGIVGRKDRIEGSISFTVDVDGNNATDALLKAVKASRFSGQIRIVALNGVVLGGLNILDLRKISSSLGVGAVAITRKRPRISLLRKALSKDPERTRKTAVLEGMHKEIRIWRMTGLYVQSLGVEKAYLERRIGEIAGLVRIAHLIASGIGHGESRGRI